MKDHEVLPDGLLTTKMSRLIWNFKKEKGKIKDDVLRDKNPNYACIHPKIFGLFAKS